MDDQIPHNAITFNQMTLTFNAELEKLEVSLGWDSMARQAIEAGRLKKLGEFEYQTGSAYYLVHSKHRPLNNKARTFHDWLIATV